MCVLTEGERGLCRGDDRSLFILCMNRRSVSSPLREPETVCLHTQIPVLGVPWAIAGARWLSQPPGTHIGTVGEQGAHAPSGHRAKRRYITSFRPAVPFCRSTTVVAGRQVVKHCMFSIALNIFLLMFTRQVPQYMPYLLCSVQTHSEHSVDLHYCCKVVSLVSSFSKGYTFQF